MSKKKLLFIVEAFGGGVFSFLSDLTRELVKDYQIYIAHSIREETPENYGDYFSKEIKLIHVDSMIRSISLKKDLKAFFELKKLVKEISPDAIHAHSSKAGVLVRWACNGKKIPVFYTPHGYSFVSSEERGFKKSIYKLVEFITAKRRSTTISCGKSEHEITLKMTKRAKFVSNGLNIENIQKAIEHISSSKHNDKFTICTIGRTSLQKNPELFNKIALKLPQVRFVWIGDGELRHKLTAENIEITGWLEKKEAYKNIVQANAFVLTSTFEGLSYALLEAMYFKKVCIVSNVIGNKDVIRDSNNGFLANTSDEFVDKINYVMNNPVNDVVEKAYQEIFSKYNTKTMSQGYKNIYEEMIS